MNAAPLVYDVGMNNGDDADYYLKKGYRVIGIDANPRSCAQCEERFKSEIREGRMVVLNVGVGAIEEEKQFFIHSSDDPLSTFAPEEWKHLVDDWQPADDWIGVTAKIRPLSSIIREQGEPYFIKIDVEHFDHIVLYELLRAGVAPPYISVEAQRIDVYCFLVAMRYAEFKLVRGKEIATRFSDWAFQDLRGSAVRHRFSPQSSGPFGEDIPGDWLNKDEALSQLLQYGLGWIDLHARRTEIEK